MLRTDILLGARRRGARRVLRDFRFPPYRFRERDPYRDLDRRCAIGQLRGRLFVGGARGCAADVAWGDWSLSIGRERDTHDPELLSRNVHKEPLTLGWWGDVLL